MSNLLLISHGVGCPDGFAAAWAANRRHPGIEIWFANHNAPPPNVTDRDVIITDFCYPREILLQMKSDARSLLVLDHHITMQKQCGDLDFCHFDMNKSGAGLAWEFFHPGIPAPWIIKYVQYRDLGFYWSRPKEEHPLYLEEILATVDSYERSFANWDIISSIPETDLATSQLVVEGQAIQRFKNQMINVLLKQAHEIEIGGHRVKAVNAPLFQSEIGNILANDPENDFGATWYQSREGIKFSLRSIDGKEDVSQVAEGFPGGGGHKKAAGFSIESLKRLSRDIKLNDR